MKNFFSSLFIVLLTAGFGQNNVRIFSANGELFTLSAFDSLQSKTPQTDFLIRTIYDDTIHIKLFFDNKTVLETTLFLFEKGKATKNKEFNYKISHDKNKTKISYSGYYDIGKLTDPLVPEKPIIDTTAKYKNTRLGHYCELKEGKPTYFSNIPKDDNCETGMPEEYLNYINLLMLKAQVADDKFLIAENTCMNNCLTVEQLNFILNYIEYEIEKLKLIKIAYFNVADKNNKKLLEKSFRFESSVIELNDFFKNAVDSKKIANSNCKTSSSEAEIKKLKDDLSIYANDAVRFEYFKKIYSGFCFSKDHILMVLGTFVHDREKLDVAKMLYYRCTEKDNFLLISDAFSYGETVSELKDFVAKQKE